MADIKKIAVGLSGGVDSTLTALLLQQQGFEVIGVTLRLHDGRAAALSGRTCGGSQSVARAQKSADELGIPLHVVDCCREFEHRVLKASWAAFETGSTPNPCFVCNTTVKFAELLNTARRLGAAKIATGHYARIELDREQRPVLRRGLDSGKDQSYFLAGLSAEVLAETLFPLGTMLKTEVKKLAAAYGLSSSTLKESQDLCFAGPEGHFSNELCSRFAGRSTPGIFIDASGRQLGRHTGIHQYTVGQRRGLGFATGERVKITSIDPASGVIAVCGGAEAACSLHCRAVQFSWNREPLACAERAMAQVRYRQSAVEAVLEENAESTLQLRFATPVFGVCPGQLLVLYQDDCVLGYGTIARCADQR